LKKRVFNNEFEKIENAIKKLENKINKRIKDNKIKNMYSTITYHRKNKDKDIRVREDSNNSNNNNNNNSNNINSLELIEHLENNITEENTETPTSTPGKRKLKKVC